ncbi:C-type mannose receptor 2-like [Seriola lalandi dorsalis]|uniref:C-type mannose receptor 2-like n=1 Tax=Seriola lalandi dorsalis TaxID=1841481 RepID=UPI000C6F71D1|nr:C-type mannose receptor 2-like [Seriola lalandi dorsalis]
MKMLTLSLFVCAMMVLTRAVALPPGPDVQMPLETFPPTHPFDNEDNWGMPSEHGFGGWVPSCPEGWTMFSTQCLLYISKEMTWGEAEGNCRSFGEGNLASVYNAEQANDIHEMMKRAGHERGQVWVGGHNTAEDPSWSWSDHLSFDIFHQWCRVEPAKHEHHCLQVNFGGRLKPPQADAEKKEEKIILQQRNCRSMGANLASVHSTQDYHQIQWLILSATHQHKDKWIGGSDTEEENIWFWSDGSPFHYTNWCHGEPSNSHGREGCLQMNFGGQKCWNDERCYIHFPSICVKRG